LFLSFFADLVQCGFPSPAQDYVEKRGDLELLVQHPRLFCHKPQATA
jgi:hypothetical protein